MYQTQWLPNLKYATCVEFAVYYSTVIIEHDIVAYSIQNDSYLKPNTKYPMLSDIFPCYDDTSYRGWPYKKKSTCYLLQFIFIAYFLWENAQICWIQTIIIVVNQCWFYDADVYFVAKAANRSNIQRQTTVNNLDIIYINNIRFCVQLTMRPEWLVVIWWEYLDSVPKDAKGFPLIVLSIWILAFVSCDKSL